MYVRGQYLAAGEPQKLPSLYSSLIQKVTEGTCVLVQVDKLVLCFDTQ